MQNFDDKDLRAGFNRTPIAPSSSCNFVEDIGKEMLSRLDYIKCQPSTILDVGSGFGCLTSPLQKRYKKTQIIGCDIAEQRMLQAKKKLSWLSKTRYLTANFSALPFKKHSFDLIVSNLCLYWASDLNLVISELARVLKPNGILLFSTLGPDSLKELREAFANIDEKPHINLFMDMHDIGDSLLKAGFRDPVMDVERLQLFAPDVATICRALKILGESNYHHQRRKGLLGKNAWNQLNSQYEQYRTNQQLPISMEVVYGHALGSQLSQQIDQQTGEIRVSIDTLFKNKGK